MANTPLELYEAAYRLHYNECKLSEAISYYEAIIKEFPESNECGYAAIQLQKIKANELVKAIEQRNKSLHPITIIALVLGALSFLILAAVGSFTIYQLKIERERISLAARAMGKIESGDYNEALKLLTQLKILDKTDIMPFELTASIHRKQGQQDEAKTEYDIFYSLNPNKAESPDRVAVPANPEPAQPKAAPKSISQPVQQSIPPTTPQTSPQSIQQSNQQTDPFADMKEPVEKPSRPAAKQKVQETKPKSTGGQSDPDSISYF
jgi:tetratricopeptide (TPR) repeat protein